MTNIKCNGGGWVSSQRCKAKPEPGGQGRRVPGSTPLPLLRKLPGLQGAFLVAEDVAFLPLWHAVHGQDSGCLYSHMMNGLSVRIPLEENKAILPCPLRPSLLVSALLLGPITTMHNADCCRLPVGQSCCPHPQAWQAPTTKRISCGHYERCMCSTNVRRIHQRTARVMSNE